MRANPTKWSNTIRLRTVLSVIYHFAGLAYKGFKKAKIQ